MTYFQRVATIGILLEIFYEMFHAARVYDCSKLKLSTSFDGLGYRQIYWGKLRK